MKGICVGVKKFANLKILNLLPIFTIKKFIKFAYNFLCEKVQFQFNIPNLYYHPLLLKNSIKILGFVMLSVKVTFKQTVKNNCYWIFLIFFLFILVFFLELETRKGRIVQRVHLYIWVAAGHNLIAIGTRAYSFNL